MAYTTINKSTDYFNTVLYTGNGSNNHTITGVNFNTDLAWIKNRGGDDHRLFDKVRGVNKFVKANTTDAETTDAIFTTNSDGYVLTNAGEVNANNGNFVGWNWKANGQGSSNTDGSINTTYTSVSTTSGVSISKYTGTGSNATVGHGLGVAPKMILIKRLSANDNWIVYHNSLGGTKNLYLDANNAEATRSDTFNNTAPTSSVFSLGSATGTNGSGSTYIAYCFAEKTGYSKFGSYTGNGSTDGTFVYTGFKPAFLLWKNNSAAEGWWIVDNKTTIINPTNNLLRPDTNAAELVGNANLKLDLLSNGFKLRQTDGALNSSGATFIYMAFAEEPLVANVGQSIPATAR